MVDKVLLNRELSWLDFNRRVLALAQDPSVPLLERAKFLAIFSSNLDEFFQVRVAGLKTQVSVGVSTPTADGMTPREQLSGIHDETASLYKEATETFRGTIEPELRAHGIAFSEWSSLDDDDRRWLDEQFAENLFPVLTPLAVDPAHPFPYISDLSLNLGVVVREPGQEGQQFARIKVPPILPRFVVMPDGERFVPLEQVIASHLPELFPGMEIVSYFAFRVTRNADLDLDDSQADDLIDAIANQLSQRRFGDAVRLEIENHVDAATLSILRDELGLSDDDVYLLDGPLDMNGLWALHGLDRPDLRDPSYTRVDPPAFARAKATGRSVFSVLREHDVLVHHPYESFGQSVGWFIDQAARDPAVLAIKMTMYRTAERSRIVQSLMRAAEMGKQVVVLVELKARFDEEANIEWAKRLETAGVHVAHGVVGLKTHCKTALVVRAEDDAIRRYAHIGTGNYNATTARIYEDLGLFTADPDIGADLSELFNVLTGYSNQTGYRKLVVSPHSTRNRLLDLIKRESVATDGHIVLKLNSLVDPAVIRGLYDASAAGTRIDLIVRGVCCLLPGVEGLSENITVRSIVGRYLEHSRVYRFGSEARGRTHLIGSADIMQRNLDGRVEALVPVTDPAHQARLDRMLDIELADDTLAWTLDDEGVWTRTTGGTLETHLAMQELHQTR